MLDARVIGFDIMAAAATPDVDHWARRGALPTDEQRAAVQRPFGTCEQNA
jgi:hypothetical protein